MQITIEGAVNSDVLEAGEQRTVELTDYVRGLLRSRLVTQIPFVSGPTAVEPEEAPESVPVLDTESNADETDPVTDRPRRARRTVRVDVPTE